MAFYISTRVSSQRSIFRALAVLLTVSVVGYVQWLGTCRLLTFSLSGHHRTLQLRPRTIAAVAPFGLDVLTQEKSELAYSTNGSAVAELCYLARQEVTSKGVDDDRITDLIVEADAALELGKVSRNEIVDMLLVTAALHDDVPMLREIVPSLSQATKPSLSEMDTKDLCNIVWAVASMHEDIPELRDLLTSLAQALWSRVNDMTAQDVSRVLWATAKLRSEAPLFMMLLPKLVRQLLIHFADLTSENVANVLWAFTALRGHTELEDVSTLYSPLIRQYMKHGGDVSVQALGDMFWSVTTLRHRKGDVRLDELLPVLFEQTDKLVDKLDSTAINNILWAATTLYDEIPEVDVALPLLVQRILSLADQLPTKTLATAVWAAGVLSPGQFDEVDLEEADLEEVDLEEVDLEEDQDEGTEVLSSGTEDMTFGVDAKENAYDLAYDLVQGIRDILVLRLKSSTMTETFKISDLKNLMVGLAYMQYEGDTTLFKLIAERAVVLEPSLTMQAFSDHYTDIIWALAEVDSKLTDLHMRTLMQTVIYRLQAEMSEKGAFKIFSEEKVTSLLESYKRLGRGKDLCECREFLQQILVQLEESTIEDPYGEDLVYWDSDSKLPPTQPEDLPEELMLTLSPELKRNKRKRRLQPDKRILKRQHRLEMREYFHTGRFSGKIVGTPSEVEYPRPVW